MGSFSEVVLGFSFRPDTPDHVLAAFSALAVPRESWQEPAPPLPAPHVIDPDEDWEPSDELSDPTEDPTPWLHDWAGWFSHSMSVSCSPSAQLVWTQAHRWTLTCRWAIKTWPEGIVPALRWLGPYLQGHPLRPILLGYIEYGEEPRPVLLWLTEGKIEAESLSPYS
ncbi:hypothetical protein [Kineococcus aurantiacus]|uniref:Uncharacterized protein n=1 Tax=Kineococcus aurantiacus TaxID=37633 RepID=A0A7Y9J3G7_9ACTN|nr:hypothetical protein [Kineococcus aurantiacus]NYD24968.1 hypothetical protein [Kineococcus aurantiacus]